MWQHWQQFFRRPSVWIATGLSGLINLATWLILLINIKPQSNVIVLHYTVYFGVDLVGGWLEALLIPAFGLVIWLTNTMIAAFFAERYRVASYFFLILTPAMELLLLMAAIFVVVANLPAGA